MRKLPMTIPTRIKQFICKHETIGMSAYTMGINRKLGWIYITYECKCGVQVGRWEKEDGQL